LSIVLPEKGRFVKKQAILSVCKYAVALGLLGFVIWRNWAPANGQGLQELWQKYVVEGQPIHYGYLLLAFVICLGSVVLTFIRWYFLVRAQGLPFTLADALRLGAVGFFFNSFLPGSVGGDIIKAAFLARQQTRRTVAVATVIMDRAIALWALFWFVGLLGLIFWIAGILPPEALQAARVIIVGSIAVTAVSWVVWILLGLLPPERAERFAGRLQRLPKIGGTAAEFWRAVWMYRSQQLAVYFVLLLCWIGHAGFVLTYYFCVLTLWDPTCGPIPPLTAHFLLVPIALVVQALPGLPGGIGLGELGFSTLYELFGCAGKMAVAGSLVQRVVGWSLGLLGYLVYLRMRPAVRELMDKKPTAPVMLPLPPRSIAGDTAAACS
jgi:uncharacterized protein (TIRG00374 family)